MKCPKCGSSDAMKNGNKNGVQSYRCRSCGKYFREESSVSQIKSSKPEIKNMGISINEFMKNNDVETQVRGAVKQLKKGTLFKRAQFISEFNISKTTGYVDVLNSDEFSQYRGNINADQQYFGHPEDINMLKEKRLLK